MTAIYKYELRVQDVQTIGLPIDAEVLDIQNQNGTICLWAKIPDTETTLVAKTIYCFGTGHAMPSNHNQMKYISTVQMSGGMLIFNFYILL